VVRIFGGLFALLIAMSCLFLILFHGILDWRATFAFIAAHALLNVAVIGATGFLLVERSKNWSGYPRAFFTLPVRTRSLVFWPWLFCTLSLAIPWFAMTVLVSQLFGNHLPLWTPCLLFAAGMACVLAAVWAPFPGLFAKTLAFVVAVLVSGGLAIWLIDVEVNAFPGAALPGDMSEPPEQAVVAVLLACLAAGCFAAHAAVACDRRGDKWLPGLARAGRRVLEFFRARPLPRPFTSPARAQCWYTFHSPFGRITRILSVACLGAYIVALDISRKHSEAVDPHLMVFGIAVCLPVLGLGVALLLYVFVPLPAIQRWLGLQLPKADTYRKRDLTLTLRFAFARPLSSGGLAAAFLRSHLLGVLTTCRLWLPVALVAGFGWYIARVGTDRAVQDSTHAFGELSGWQCLGLAVLLGSGGVAVLWRMATELPMSAPPGRGRTWVEFALSFGMVIVNGLATVGVSLLLDSATRDAAVSAVAWMGITLLAAKALVATWAFRALRRAGLFDATAFHDFRRCWLAVAVPAVASTAVLLPSQLPIPAWLALLWIMVFLPLGRFALITFGFDWRRHGERPPWLVRDENFATRVGIRGSVMTGG
jgi:hypothetical protein